MRISDWSSDVCSSDLRTSPRALRVNCTGGFSAGAAVELAESLKQQTNRVAQAAAGEGRTMQTKRRWAPGHDARATHRAGALAGCIDTLAVVLSVAACGHGSAVDPISVDADSAVVPRAVCGP